LLELAWLPVDKLGVDTRYQRTLESRRSQKLIEDIAERFRWSAFQAVLATIDAAQRAAGRTGWLVIDGQHRVEAARRRGITHVPAVVVSAASIEEQAAAFVHANTDRVSVNAFALHHARRAAGDPGARATDALCRKAGVTIPRYPIPADKLAPRQTLALGTVAQLPKLYGDATALIALKTVADAWGERPGAVRAAIIRAVAKLVHEAEPALRAATAESIRKALQAKGPDEMQMRALRRRQHAGGTEITALAFLIGDEMRRASRMVAGAGAGGFIAAPTREQLMRGR
jgi:hypothetical protein